MSNRNWVIGWCAAEVILLLLLLWILPNWAPYSGYARSLPCRYAAIVLPWFIAGLAITALSYIYTLLWERPSKVSMLFLVMAALFIGLIGGFQWMGLWHEGEVDYASLCSWVFAAVAAGVSGYEWQRTREKHWQLIFFCVDLPLFVGLFVTMIFKYWSYDYSNAAYNDKWVQIFSIPNGSPPDWPAQNLRLQEAARANFWTGFSAGVVSIQLITAQMVSIALRLHNVVETDAKKSDGEITVKPS